MHTLADATAAATQRWIAWRIRRRTSSETDIPRGLPYLTGFVLQAGIEAEAAAVYRRAATALSRLIA